MRSAKASMDFIGIMEPRDYYLKPIWTFTISAFSDGWFNSYHGKEGESVYSFFPLSKTYKAGDMERLIIQSLFQSCKDKSGLEVLMNH